MKILKKSLTGLLMLGVLLAFIYLTSLWDGQGQYFFDALVLVVLALSTFEMYKCAKAKGYNVELIPLIIVVLGVYPAIKFLGYFGFFMMLCAGMILSFCFFVFDRKVELKDMLMTLFIMLYPITPIMCVLQTINAYGMLPFLLAAASAMLADTIAYFAGTAIKGPKIFPRISPNKTYSGSICGLFGGVAGAFIVYAMFEVASFPVNAPIRFTEILGTPNAEIFYAFMGLAIAIVSQIGDIFASKVKREFGVKDFSTLLGSHGGIIDRIDSIIFAVLFVAVVVEFLPVAVAL
ncbi:MAG: phosphatidate cytidylyltransferase [Clostridia bacterium]|nr:phosphatidate cytidylyltransferase [Clostridia bacterium]